MEEPRDLPQPQKRVERLIFRDELTDVFNRRYLYQYLPQEISRSKSVNQNVWLFMIDIDDFKSINDKYGHLRGDGVLKAVAGVLSKCVRSEDTVIRYAGDEFTIVLPGADIAGVTVIAKRINTTVSHTPIKSNVAGQLDINVNLSIGIASFPDDAADAVRIIDLADKALYVSKQKGKNRVSFVSDISKEVLRAKEILEIFPCPILIERDEALNKLAQAFSQISQDNKSRLVLISSDVGTGKSRLIDEFSKATEKKAVTFFIKCSENFMMQPYRNLLVNLESYLKTAQVKKKALLNNLSSEQLIVLAKMFPSLRDLYGLADSANAKTSENYESNIESGLKQLIINISSGNKLSLIFDDFQWIDENTLKLIFSLKIDTFNILILCSLRKEVEVLEAADYPVNRLKEALMENVNAEIVLGNLSYLGTREMISAIFPNMERSDKLDGLVYKVTNGNPLFIEELLKFLIQKGFIYYQKGNWGKIEIQESDIPQSLEEVILERFRSLDKTTQELISKAAVIGQDFNIGLLHYLGKQDEGYILDILESAQRAGLIKNRKAALGGAASGEELSFVSEEIRRVLYGLIEQDKIKDLHKQLGEIEEGLYADNVDQIAGELFYHFKKAEDFHRAKVYAGMVKEAQGLVYDSALKYARNILEGVEEEKIAPLSKKSLELSAHIVRQLYILNINSLLYPAGSSMITTPLEDLFGKLSEIFVRDELITFSQVKGELVVNGQRLKEGLLKKMFEEAFLNFLRSNHIESITFKRGLNKQGFIDFINILTHPSDEKTPDEELKTKGIYQIEIQHVDYAATSLAEKTQERERIEENMLLDYLLSKISGSDKPADIKIDWDSRAAEMAQVLNQIADKAVKEGSKDKTGLKEVTKASAVQKTFQNIGSQLLNKNPQDWKIYKKGLAKTILNLEPQLRREVLLSDKPGDSFKKKDIIKELAAEFPDDVVVDLISSELKENVSSSKMRNLVQKFLSTDEQRQRITPVLKDNMSKLGISKEDVAWIVGELSWKDLNLEERVRRFLAMAASEYLNSEHELDTSLLINEILNNNRQDLFNAVLDKWKEFLKEESLDLRRGIVESFMRIIDSIPISRPELLVILFDIVFSQLESEAQPDIYTTLIKEIVEPLGHLIDSGNFAHAKIILEKLNKEKLRIKDFSQGGKCIQEVMEKIFTADRLKLIAAEFTKRIDSASYYDDIKDFMLNIGEAIVKPLMDEAMIEDKVLSYLGYFGAYLRRRGIGETLKALISRYGPNVVIDELQEKLIDKKWYIVKNAIELFVYLHDPEIVKLLEKPLKHPDVNIRKKVIFALNKIPVQLSSGFLIEALKDPDMSIRSSTIAALAKIGDESVLAALRNSHQPDLQVELNRAIESVEKSLGRQ